MRNDKKLKKVFFLLQHEILKEDEKEQLKKRFAAGEVEVIFDCKLIQCGDLGEEILYICDTRNSACQIGKNVLIFLHEKNREEDFSGFQYFIEGFEDADVCYFKRVYERLAGIAWIITETKRLRIREMTLEDMDAIYALYDRPELIPFLPPLYENREEEREYLKRYIRNMYGIFEYGMWLIEKKDDGEIVGRIGVENTEAEDELSFGFLVHPKHWRRGFAQEAGEAVLSYLAQELPQLQVKAFCHPDNKAAVLLCQKLGIKVEYIL